MRSGSIHSWVGSFMGRFCQGVQPSKGSASTGAFMGSAPLWGRPLFLAVNLCELFPLSIRPPIVLFLVSLNSCPESPPRYSGLSHYPHQKAFFMRYLNTLSFSCPILSISHCAALWLLRIIHEVWFIHGVCSEVVLWMNHLPGAIRCSCSWP